MNLKENVEELQLDLAKLYRRVEKLEAMLLGYINTDFGKERVYTKIGAQPMTYEEMRDIIDALLERNKLETVFVKETPAHIELVEKKDEPMKKEG